MSLTAHHAFGLQITDSVIKAAELAPIGNTFQLIAFGSKSLPATTIVDGVINDEEFLANELRDMIEKPQIGQFTTPYVACSIPESRVFIKAIKMPNYPKKKLDEAILWEARSLLPVPPEKAIYRFRILETKPDNVYALVAATEKSLTDGYLKVLEKVKLKPISFDLESNATLRTIDDNLLANHILLQIHIGIQSTTMTILRNGQIWFSHAIATGEMSMLREIAQQQPTHVDDILSLRPGLDLNHVPAPKTLHEIHNAILSTIKYYQEQIVDDGSKVQEIILTGANASIPGLVTNLGADLKDVPVSIATPRLQFNDDMLKAGVSPTLICIGLGLRGAFPARWSQDINCLPDTYIQLEDQIENSRKQRIYASVYVYLALGLLALSGFLYWRLQMEFRNLQIQLAEKTGIIEQYKDNSKAIWVNTSNQQLAIFTYLEKNRFPFGLVFQHIASNVPQGVVLQSIAYSRTSTIKTANQVQLTGSAISRSHILGFAAKLRSDPMILTLSVPYSSFDKETDIPFTMTFTFDPAKL